MNAGRQSAVTLHIFLTDQLDYKIQPQCQQPFRVKATSEIDQSNHLVRRESGCKLSDVADPAHVHPLMLGSVRTEKQKLHFRRKNPHLLLIRDRAGMYQKDYGVVNLGPAAYGGEQSLLVLERFASRLGSPVACLYLGSDNDYDDNLVFRNGDRHRHVVKVIRNGARQYRF